MQSETNLVFLLLGAAITAAIARFVTLAVALWTLAMLISIEMFKQDDWR